MKKRVFFYFISLILILTPLVSAQGAVIVEVNEAYNFDVLKAMKSISIGENSANAVGFEIDGQHFGQGTSVNLNITNLGFLSSVSYNISTGGYSEINSINTLGFYFSILLQVYEPFSIINDYSNVSEWDQAAADEDPGILIYPFLNNDTSTWNYLLGYVDDAINGTLLDSYPGTDDVETNGSFTNTTTFFMCEIYYEGIYHHNVTEGSELILVHSNVKHNLQMAFNKTNGVMLGIRVKGTLSGVANETAIFIQYEQHTELEGYNLPNFEFGVDITPTPTPSNSTGNPLGDNLPLIIGLSIGIPVVVAIVVTTIVLVNKKRKSAA
ncbi:MAG: hypothetical protein FK733_15410 [Asgard group archaeon]|nr:hypothetical protein [Asgard group archaeon]